MVPLKQIFSNQELSIDDLSYISKLIDTNLSLRQIFILLENKNNSLKLKAITKALDDGRMIEEVIKDYLPKQIKEYMIPLLKTLSFQDSLKLSLQFYERHQNSQNSLLGKIAYPCILMFISISVLYLFDIYGMDTIFNLIRTFKTDLGLYDGIRTILRIAITIFYYGLLIGVLLLVIITQPKRISLFYMFVCKHFPNSLINIYYCEEFISLLLICVKHGYKTKEALSILMSMKSKPIVSFLAYHIDEALLEGESLKQATRKQYYDSTLSRFIKIANYTNDFANMLESYTLLARTRMQKKLKAYALTIQLATYSFIGIIVIFVYQILFMPMQALSAY